jgi:hypothetical protein
MQQKRLPGQKNKQYTCLVAAFEARCGVGVLEFEHSSDLFEVDKWCGKYKRGGQCNILTA